MAGVGGSGVRFERSAWLLEAEVSCGFLGDCFRCRVDEVAFLLDDVGVSDGDDGPGVDVGFVGEAAGGEVVVSEWDGDGSAGVRAGCVEGFFVAEWVESSLRQT